MQIKRDWQQIKLDINETGIDRQELLSWSIKTLIAAAGQAMKQKNPCAVVACIRQQIRAESLWQSDCSSRAIS